MQSNTDVSVGEVWTTASWAIVLGAHGEPGKAGFVGWCARKAAPAAAGATTGAR